MKKFFLVFTLVIFCIIVRAQTSEQFSTNYRNGRCNTKMFCPRNAIFHETNWDFSRLGINSIKWDHILKCGDRSMVSFCLGINYFTFPKVYGAGVPLELNLLIGRSALLFEMGLGINYLYFYKNYDNGVRYTDNVHWGAITGRLGLRYEAEKSLFLRAGFTPMYAVIGNNDVPYFGGKPMFWMAGLGIGYTFRSR
jgi:hypothetical protein